MRHYDIDAVVAQPTVTDRWITANCGIRDTAWFEKNAHRFDRILYQFGNSVFHQHMFDLLERHPGIVALHDFYLSGVIAQIELSSGNEGFWSNALYRSHGYHVVHERHTQKSIGYNVEISSEFTRLAKRDRYHRS